MRAAAVALVLALAGCIRAPDRGASPADVDVTRATMDLEDPDVRLEAVARWSRGVWTVVATARNEGSRAYWTPECGGTWTDRVMGPDGRTLQAHEARFGTCETASLGPGGERNVTLAWDQRNWDNNPPTPVPAGDYEWRVAFAYVREGTPEPRTLHVGLPVEVP